MASIAFGARTGSNSSSVAVTTLAVTVTVNSGDTVIVAVATENTAIAAPTDNAAGGSNVYQKVTAEITNTDSIQLWMCVNAKAATTVTANFTSSKAAACVACYTGGTLAKNGNTNTGAAANPTLNTTQDAGESWVITGFAAHGIGAFTAGTGNLRVSVAGASSTSPGCAIVDNKSTAGATVTTSTTHTAVTWAAASAVLGMAYPELL